MLRQLGRINRNNCWTPQKIQFLKMSQIGELGSGAGKGGGGGGSIREAGGSLGKMEAAHEEEYFHRQQREQLKSLKASAQTETPAQGPGADKK